MRHSREVSVPEVRSQIPHGVQDRFMVEAARRRQVEAVLREQFCRWGYQEVITPTFEYYDNLTVGASPDLQQAMYRFFDRDGHTLALRADFTPQIARTAATKLYDQPMPLRCFYIGSLFRYEEPQAGRKREFTQAGVELIGADTPAADAEVVALSVAALGTLNLPNFQVNLGQMAFFHAVTAGLSPESVIAIREAIDRKSAARLTRALVAPDVTASQRELLARLPDCVGGAEVLQEARALSTSLPEAAAAMAAIDRLADVYRLLQIYGIGHRVILDLGEVRGMDYYTGITFRGMVPGLGWPVLSGGRYDNLIANFGRSLPAVGFGLGIERVLLLQSQHGMTGLSIIPHLLVQGCDHSTCHALMQRLRTRGCRIEVDVLGLSGPELHHLARQRGISRTLRCTGEEWVLSDERGDRLLTENELWQEVEAWLAGESLPGRR